MNINKVHFNVRPGFGKIFSSVTAPFRRSNIYDDEIRNPYTGMVEDESTSRIQGFYDRNGGSLQSFLSSAGSIFGWSGAKTESLGTKRPSLFGNVTPSFLWEDEDDMGTTCCPNMSYKKRIFGCICLLILGQLLQATCWLFFGGVMLGHPEKFATMYTLGNLAMLCASLFFSGPTQQIKKIMTKKRGFTFLTFFTTMSLTLMTVFSRAFIGRTLLILILMVVQWMALMWYILSFIPHAQGLVSKVFGRLRGWFCPF